MYNRENYKVRFLEDLLRDFSLRAKRGDVEINRLYNGYKTMLENEINKSTDRVAQIKERYEILDKVYKIFSDGETRDLIANNGITAKSLMEKYGERIIGDNKRTYGMSEMFNQDLISSYKRSDNTIGKKIKFIPKEGDPYRIPEISGKTVTIRKSGELYFQNYVGVQKDLARYKIQKRDNKTGEVSEFDVFTNISIVQMDEPQYRDAVLYELLGENNIELSNAEGYVGSIAKANPEIEEGKERKSSDLYTYRIDDKYGIEYDAEELTAVTLFKQYEKSLKEKSENSNKKDNEGPQL